MARFDRDYTALLADLADLPGDPHVVVMQSYSLGPDLQGLPDNHPFHPTAVGSLRIAAELLPAVESADGDE